MRGLDEDDIYPNRRFFIFIKSMAHNTINKKDFLKLTKNYQVIWFGEIHGIQENYEAYRMIVPILARIGFKNILWEMDSDFSGKSPYSEDGRINPFSIDFLGYIHKKIKEKVLNRLVFFGKVNKPAQPNVF
jgi:hypothetical protein